MKMSIQSADILKYQKKESFRRTANTAQLITSLSGSGRMDSPAIIRVPLDRALPLADAVVVISARPCTAPIAALTHAAAAVSDGAAAGFRSGGVP